MQKTEQEYNQNIKLTFYDVMLRYTLLPLIPSFIRPNHVTMFRLFASPAVFLLFLKEQYFVGLIVFVAVALTDAIDGALARTRKQITIWGIAYDPVADKFLIGGTVLILVIKHLGIWLAGFIVGLETLGIFGVLYFRQKGTIHPANLWGKIKMNLQVIATVVLLVDVIWGRAVWSDVSIWIFVSSIAFGILSIIVHVRRV
ncbi:hypothetical protein A3B21_03035 [Candidatus Uhrbacteria bacterium RIFCSPLOWO2_01_FULL_47_24]|uniref:CDP-diacylglycerol--glycerol-3-phosphate 3-phosphatidyltransferase n=1 Tax=Candidatus Uhrbacteria bacterium RIFCSPLOWO2_01_FULL_47_24 TaxID=1802401 RepID=A0A1F7URP7_9BACT|nr:MAG: hypothetical protein A2753_04960 [Candidatus Uhrbacteria bacterium RIFCSPHIGHO2_01_FULL_47_11]OGL67561.1 MAG: hypothetical protein A3D58_03635 [Candidatus Uhrbacteria bacterium RIFCSPHIGHO2_02_FULL_46_47]OGL75158.1 MAG: hypothetical protein A3F52_02650 [Candidatus Uhrbacteria bacterium RIFCSPHIGHO2_12_FULL_47_11]OGL80915.1 MAG: hypothetical protein A3B21_03035 [Candidatus Uhrbacteria bacterium RIFCSPLOWO2_01_FULL_47_24]OGL84250.1 MAG: hypothetical protein A3J03_03035 [Candidatus Uhrbact